MLIAEAMLVERGGRLALAAPDFRIGPGEAGLVSGPNGAGKSTLLRALAGLSPLTGGRALLAGPEGETDLTSDRDGFVAHVAYAGHLDAVKPALTVRENLAAWAAIYGGAAEDAAIEDALARFALGAVADAPASYCSAGQKRRLGLARLLTAERRLWLLDEPTVSLDAVSVVAFAELVAEHCSAGGLALAASHVDIGLPAGPKISLTPPSETAAASADPFLAGTWS